MASDLHFDNITVSGKIAVGATTLSKSLSEILGWKHVNAGAIQREYDRSQGRDENMNGALARSDQHEMSIEEKGKQLLETQTGNVYEAWLSGFIARDMKNVLKVLVICSSDDIRVDRVMNRESVDLETAKTYIHKRESENIEKWNSVYGDYDFWNPEYFDIVVDTYSSGPMETVGIVLDKLGYKGEI